ncbi:egg-laying defective protein 27-like [Bombus pyrosoma]|uniref:egg-laying defective protein 27-like n=1 Tax=Bombus pyrosoma TaxID=396416 RepID=UPI001CB98077|nr:egg-laying defective protein 27-like [Bombus pyrosoma]
MEEICQESIMVQYPAGTSQRVRSGRSGGTIASTIRNTITLLSANKHQIVMGISKRKMPRKSAARRKRNASSQTKKKKKTIVPRMEHAVIPECQDRSYADKEYTTSREEKMWDPKMDVERWFPGYIMAARTLLTLKQQYGDISNMEAMDNSCSGDAEQYISDVLHDSEYDPDAALQLIFTNNIPEKIITKWKPEEMQLFTEGIMKHGKRFSIIRREMLPHKRVEEFAEFYYVWKRSKMAEAWRKSRAEIKAEKKKMQEKRLKKKTFRNQSNNIPPCDLSNNIPPCGLSNNILPCDLSNNRRMTRSATAAARRSLQNSEGTDDDSRSSTSTNLSEKNEETSSAAESTDSSKGHVQKAENGLPESATSEMSPMKNEQFSDNSMKCPKQRRERKSSTPRKIVNLEEESEDEIEEIKCVTPPIIPQWKRQRRFKNTLLNDTRAIYHSDLQFLI